MPSKQNVSKVECVQKSTCDLYCLNSVGGQIFGAFQNLEGEKFCETWFESFVQQNQGKVSKQLCGEEKL